MPFLLPTFHIIERLMAVAILLQTFEMMQIKEAITSIWSWEILKKDYEFLPAPLQKYLSFLLDGPHFFLILDARVFLAILLLVFPQPLILLALLLTALLICLRWRGPYNGGSDMMTMVVLLALTVGSFFHNHSLALKACLWYIAVQVCLSYWIAGIAKLRKPHWRNGRALYLLVTATNYETPIEVQQLLQNSKIAKLASWLILIFECTFPLALLSPDLCLIYIAAALFFQLGNFFVFGLNRFVFAWLAAYPALYWCSHLSKVLTPR